MSTEICQRLEKQAKCGFCGNDPGEPCPLHEAPPFAGPAVGAVVAVGECSGGEVCESCQ
jgi:hypothetical protein